MILYLGTSSLVKFYVEENDSAMVREWVKDAEIVATCRVAFTETVAAVEERLKDRDLSKRHYDRIMERFSRDWPHFLAVDFDELETARFVRKYGLRRFDAIHLSAANLIRKQGGDVSLVFASADAELNRAARAEGFSVRGPDGSSASA